MKPDNISGGKKEKIKMSKANIVIAIIFVLSIISCSKTERVLDDSLISKQNGLIFVKTPYTGSLTHSYKGLISRKTSYKNGIKNGEMINYFQNGKIKDKAFFSDGKLNGKVLCYYKTGELSLESSYKNGKKDGAYIEYYKNGQIKSKKSHKNGKKCGEWIYYNEDGTIKFKKKFEFNADMIKVKGGTFEMGNKNGKNYEKPVHKVTLSSFYIGKYEVTQKEWKAIMGNNPSSHKGDNYPVENVSWEDIQDFLKKLNANTKHKYRLPTEAEWEYACRGGVSSNLLTYSGANTINSVAWYGANSGTETHLVGTKQPNELGIYDMSGNVMEWCSDLYDKNYYTTSPSKNPTGKNKGSNRVIRGGSWGCDAINCEVTSRYNYDASKGYGSHGFRLARSL